MSSCTLGGAFLLLLAGAGPASGDWIREFRGEVSYDGNLSNSNRSADQRDDFSFVGHFRFGRFGELTDNLRFTLAAELEAQAFARYEDFNNLAISSTVGLRYRFGLGARAPFVRLEASGGYAVFDQSLQSGGRYRTGIVMGKRLSERLALNASYFFEDIRGDIPLFDRCSHAFALAASFDLTARTQLSAGYELREGRVISYAVPPRPDIVAIANDRRTVDSFGTPYVAYNLDATSHALSFGVNQALTDVISLSLRYEWQHTGRSQISYVNNVLRVSFHAAF